MKLVVSLARKYLISMLTVPIYSFKKWSILGAGDAGSYTYIHTYIHTYIYIYVCKSKAFYNVG